MQRVSAIVTTKNAARTLQACLASIRNQSYGAIEIVVVDNASTDGTMQIAAALADTVLSAGPERSVQRNAGILAAGGHFVLILDADMVLDADVVSRCVEAYLREGGPVAVPEISFGSGYWSTCKAVERSCYTSDALVSAARFFERETVLRLGGYDESLTGPEDWDMSMRAAAGRRVVFANACIKHDEGHQTLIGLYRKKKYYGRSMRRFVAKHGREALLRVNPMRGSLMKGLPRLLSRPWLTPGIFCMKAVEFIGLAQGIITGTYAKPETIYRSSPYHTPKGDSL